jgi:hypothetical protein
MADQPERKKISLNVKPAGDSETLDAAATETNHPVEAPKIEPPKPIFEMPEKAADSSISDPTSMRDFETTRLERVKPEDAATDSANVTKAHASAGTNPGDEKLATETVHLKVIKEKKKQLAGILSASQTIRLRPQASGEPDVPPDEPGDGGRKTLKLKAPERGARPASVEAVPAAGDKPPLKLSPQVKKPIAAPPPPASSGGGRATLKIKAPTGPTPVASSAAAPAAGAPGEKKPTLKIKAPSPATGAVPAAEPSCEGGRKPTLKIKAPAGATGQMPASGSDGAVTGEQPTPGPGRTLKLKSSPKKPPEAQEPPGVAPAPGADSTGAPPGMQPIAKKKAKAGAQPGVVYTILNVLSIATVGATVYLFITHFNNMFSL